MPSETDPTGGKEDHSSSRTFKSMPTLFGSYVARIPSTLQSPVTPLDLCLPQIDKNHSDEVFASRNCSISAQRSASSNSAYNARELENWQDEAEVGGANGHTKEIEVAAEGEEVTKDIEGLVVAPARVLSSSTTSHPTSMALWLTSTTQAPATMSPTPMALQPTSTTRTPTKTSPPSTVSRLTSTAPCISTSTPSFHSTPAIPFPHSFAQAILQPPSARLSLSSTTRALARTSSQTTVSQFTSTAPHIPSSTTNFCPRPSIPLPGPYPSPHSFAKAIHQPSARSSLSSTSRSTSAASRPSSTVSPSSTTSQPTTNLHPGPTMSLPCSIPLLHSFVNTISPPWTHFSCKGRHTRPSISTSPSRNLCHPAAPLHSPSLTPLSTTERAVHVAENKGSTPPLTPDKDTPFPPSKACQPRPNTRNEQAQPELPPSTDIPTVEDEQRPPLRIRTIAAHRSGSSAHTGNARGLEGSKDKAKVGKVAEQVVGEIEGEGVTTVLCTHSFRVQLTAVPDDPAGELKTMPARTAAALQPLSAGLQPSSTGLQPSSMTLRPSTALRRSPKALWSSPTAPRSASRGPYIPCSAPNLHQWPTIPLPCSIPLPHSCANMIP